MQYKALKRPVSFLCFALLAQGCKNTSSVDFQLPNPFNIEVTGDQYHWLTKYPGKDGLLYTLDDIYGKGDIHLPNNRKVHITFKSNDFLYFVDLPELHQKSMAVPGVSQELDINTKGNGIMQFKGNQMCGYSHKSLVKKVVIESDREIIKWFVNQGKKAAKTIQANTQKSY